MSTTTQAPGSWRRVAFVGGFVAIVVLSLGWMAQESVMLSADTENPTQQALSLSLATEGSPEPEPTTPLPASTLAPSSPPTPNSTVQEPTSPVVDAAAFNSTSFPVDWPSPLPASASPKAVDSPSESPSRAPVTTSPVVERRRVCVRLSHREPRYEQLNPRLCLSRSEVQSILRGIVFATAELFESHNVAYFLESGTLLGSYRDKGLIPYDSDADFGISMDGLKYLQNTPVQVPDGYEFTVWNSRLYPHSSRDDKLPARLIHKATGLYADVFAFHDWGFNSDGRRLIGPLPSVCFHNCVSCRRVGRWERHLQVPYDWVFPLVDCPFDGRTLKCPREAATYLRHMYGADFMHPTDYGRI